MKKTATILWALLLSLFVSLPLYAEGVLAFPGAEGFGRFATGGRGGTIYHVTNLNDSGEGSLRDAVSKPGRIIVFDVSGVIKLKSALVFSSNLTVLGQTAPGEGIQVYGERVSFSGANNIIVRYMRFRMGVGGTSGKDACGVANGKNMIFDHLSALWGRDECFSISWDKKGTVPTDITIQNSIIGQGLQSHSCGGLIQTEGGVTLYRNLYIENKTRNPKVKGLNQFVNNVVYNWGGGGCYIMGDSEGPSWAHIENNYFMKGPWKGTAAFTRGNDNFKYYAAGNYYDTDADGTVNGHEMTDAEYDASGSYRISDLETFDGVSRPKVHPEIANMMSAEEALMWIIDSVGPCLPVRDEVDQYLIDELKSFGKKGSTNGISSERDLPHGGTGTLYGGYKPLDTDGDGIPDEWELANGLNPNDPSDAVAIADNGYAHIENYSFSITSAYPYIKNPSELKVAAQEKESIALSWVDNADNESGFVIEISTDNKTFTEAGRVAANVTTHTVSGLIPETVYYFRLKAYSDEGVNSLYTSTLTTETIGDPSAPKLSENPSPAVDAEVGTANDVVFTWENATKPYYGKVTYAVYAGTSPDNLEPLATGLTATSYRYGSVEADKTYYWRVDATNDVGTTTGTVWSFTAFEGGILFYTDFNTQPEDWKKAYGSISGNTNIINGKNTSKTVGGMKFGAGGNTIRVVAMSAANNSSDMSKDYGPATEADAGATDRCVQFYSTASGGYLQLPEVEGPCMITIWAGNPDDKKSKTFKLNTIVDGAESNVASFTLGNKKRIYKFQYVYMGGSKVTFKIDANAAKFNINDIRIDQYIPEPTDEPITLVSSPETESISYADGSISFTFNQIVAYHGGATFNGEQYEKVNISASGASMTINYSALDINTEYTVSFPEGALTDYTGTKSFVDEITFSTCDFPAAKSEGDTHYGKAAASLPLDFAPFTDVAPFETVGGLVQTAQNDYPHWVQASGEIGESAAVMTSTSDKIMAYFDGRSSILDLGLDYSGEGKVELKIQESRNCDIAPGWRTVRVLTEKDFPFDEELYLNSETRFVKISAPTLSAGNITVGKFRLSDAEGRFDTSGLSQVRTVPVLSVSVQQGVVTVAGLTEGEVVRVVTLAGSTLCEQVAVGDTVSFSLSAGAYLLMVDGHSSFKLVL